MVSTNLMKYYEMKQQQEQQVKERAEVVTSIFPFGTMSEEKYEYLQALIKEGKFDSKVLMSECYKNISKEGV